MGERVNLVQRGHERYRSSRFVLRLGLFQEKRRPIRVTTVARPAPCRRRLNPDHDGPVVREASCRSR